MSEIALTPRLATKLAELFATDEQQIAHQLLLSECGPRIPGGFADPMWIERVRAAALKISSGSLDKLAEATALGQIDWRDLVMAADFSSLNAHEVWLDDPISE
ncbi:hypothetical protein [Pelagerythrobacter marensis]|uniref:hypothetical protein n=1 Tax=Pelagerythrobacter marensis TaxID=543877 RepID=UPI0012E03897|nr:hypothetical protein [Pelagerythrobacter marensis]